MCPSSSHFPRRCVHSGSSYDRCKGRCFIRVLQLGRGIFPVNFRISLLLWNVDAHFDRASSQISVCPRSGLHLGRGIFPVNFRVKWLLYALVTCCMRFDCAGSHKVCARYLPYKMVVVKCWRVFRLRVLTQSVCPRSGFHLGCGIFPANFRVKLLLWSVDVHFDWAGPHKVSVCVCVSSFWTLGSIWAAAFFLGNFRIKWLLWNADVHFDYAGSHKVCVRVLGSIWAAAFFL